MIIHTTTTYQADPIKWDDLLDTYRKAQEEFDNIPNEFRCADDVYKRLKKLTIDTVKNNKGVTGLPEQPYCTSIFGMKILIDPDMKPGEWKFVY